MADFASGRPPGVNEARDLVQFLHTGRAANGLADRPFDIALGGVSLAGPAGRDVAGPLADVGVTCWVERVLWGDDMGRAAPVLRRLEQGPPRI